MCVRVSSCDSPVRASRFFFLPERQCAHPCDASLLAGEKERRKEREVRAPDSRGGEFTRRVLSLRKRRDKER